MKRLLIGVGIIALLAVHYFWTLPLLLRDFGYVTRGQR